MLGHVSFAGGPPLQLPAILLKVAGNLRLQEGVESA